MNVIASWSPLANNVAFADAKRLLEELIVDEQNDMIEKTWPEDKALQRCNLSAASGPESKGASVNQLTGASFPSILA